MQAGQASRLSLEATWSLHQLIRCPQRFNSARGKFLFKIRKQCRKLRGRFDFTEVLLRAENFDHLGKIRRIIGSQKKMAAGRECGTGQRREVFINEPVLVMPLLWPGIGKINMDGVSTTGGQEILQKIRRFYPDTAQIVQARAAAFAVELGNAPEQALDADEIFFRMLLRPFNEKSGVPAAQFHFQWLRLWEKPG